MFVKIHVTDKDVILAACDEELVGKVFRGDGTRLDVSEVFYKGESVSRDVLANKMKSVTIMNLVGEGAVAVAIEEGYATEDSVIEIDGVRHVQVVLM
jgi:hypothetical protein